MIRFFRAAAIVAAVATCFVASRSDAQSGLQVTYSGNGLQALSFNGTTLEDLSQYPGDGFHIYHMKMTDMQGNVVSSGQYGWGENNSGRSWDGNSHAWTYQYVWGTIRVQFVQNGNNLDTVVTETNYPSSGMILDGAAIFALQLHFPQLPANFNSASYPQLAYTTTAPSVTTADYGAGEVVAVAPDAGKPLYSGFWPTGNGNSYSELISGTTPDGLAAFNPHFDRPVQPGQTDTFTVSLRFAPSGTSTTALAGDAYANWAQTWPAQLHWTNRQPIGAVYMASSPQTGDIHQPGGFPNNPRRYLNDSNASDFDIRTASGLAAFQAKILQRAADSVANMRQLGAQGEITWDLEGQQYPQDTSYVCSPDMIAQVAPEMESVITDAGSPYVGMKLDDAFFKVIRDAGLRVGVCARPQHFTQYPDGSAAQVVLGDSASIVAELTRKIQYAHDRWGATLFYLDSTVDGTGGTLEPAIFQQVAAKFPDSLLVPEESTPKYYAYTAPFQTFIFHGDTGTDPTVRAYYPNAFSVILINDVDASRLAAAQSTLVQSVKGGDVLVGHATYWQANDPTIVSMYQQAGAWNPSANDTITSPTTPASTSTSTGSSTGSSTSTSSSSSSSTSSAGASSDPSSNAGSTSSTSSSSTASTSSSSTSSTSTSSTSTSSTSSPAPPSTTSSAPTTNVSMVTPREGDTLSGAVTVTATVAVPLDAAGSYLMVDGKEWGTARVLSSPFQYPLDTTVLTNGAHILQLWAHDIGNNTWVSSTVNVTVANGESQNTSSVTSGTSASTSSNTQTSSASSSGSSSTSSASSSDTSQTAPTASTGITTGSSSLTTTTSSSSSTPTATTPVTTTPAMTVTAVPTGPASITYPVSGQGIGGVVQVTAAITHPLDAAGSYLMLDGVEVGTARVTGPPYLYALDTSTLPAGQHVLQVWAHDLNNMTLLSDPVTVIVSH